MKRNRLVQRPTGRIKKKYSAELQRSQVPTVRTASQRVARPEDGSRGHDDEVLHHLASLLDSVKTGIISLDGEGRIRVFNAAAQKLFGLPGVMVVGRHMNEIDRMMGFEEQALRALWERLSDAVWAAGAALDLEFDMTGPKGLKRIIAYSVYPLGRMEWSVGNGVVIKLEDITRKKEMEDQITDGRKRLQTVFDGITDGIQVLDKEYRVMAVNKSMHVLVGTAVVVGQGCYKVCASTPGGYDECPASRTFSTGHPASRIMSFLRRDILTGEAEERILEISTFPLLDRANRVHQVVEYIKDVTDRVRLAQRLEHSRRLAAIGEMAARVAHEVRNPLNAITGAAHFLAAEYPEDETMQKFTGLIKRQSHRVDQVASDILHAAKPLKLNRTRISVDAVVDQAIGALRDVLQAQAIVVVRQRDNVLFPVYVDEVQIEQAVYNLLKNAVESMQEGGTLMVETCRDARPGWVRIVVQDNGCGIQPQDRDRIFRAFFTTKTHGTGLGLSIVEGAMKNHGGSVSVEQAEGGGTRFTLRLPEGTGGIPRNPAGQAPRTFLLGPLQPSSIDHEDPSDDIL